MVDPLDDLHRSLEGRLKGLSAQERARKLLAMFLPTPDEDAPSPPAEELRARKLSMTRREAQDRRFSVERGPYNSDDTFQSTDEHMKRKAVAPPIDRILEPVAIEEAAVCRRRRSGTVRLRGCVLCFSRFVRCTKSLRAGLRPPRSAHTLIPRTLSGP